MTIEAILAQTPIVTDGAWGTEFQKQGLRPGELPDTWNLSRPQSVEAVARAYVDAGSRVILTNTFRANRVALPHPRLQEINCTGVAISRRAAAGRALVFASMGPAGKSLAAFAEQARWLAGAGADALVVETMTDLEEAAMAVTAASATGLPVVASMVFDSGATPEQAAPALESAGASVIGANCGSSMARCLEICHRLHAATARPIWMKPNAGLGDLMTPEEFAAYAPEFLRAGASFLGGCCGTDPQFIRALKQRIAARVLS